LNLTDLFKLAFASLRDRKLRSSLTILGLVIGPAVIVALVSVTQGFSDSVSKQFSKMGVNTMMVMPSKQTVKLATSDVQRIGQMQDVAEVLPFYRVVATLKYGGKNTAVIIMGIDTGRLSSLFPGISIAEGRAPSQADIAGAVIGYSLANPTDPEAMPIKVFQLVTAQMSSGGQTISRSFLVQGSLASFGQGIFINPDETIFIPLTAGRMLTKSIYYGGIFVVATGPDKVNGVIDSITDYFGDDVRIVAVSSILGVVQTITGSIAVILSSVAFISVIVAFIGIMTTMFTTVIERTREIGLLKALGFKARDIMMVFISESILTGVIGGIIGIGLGSALSYGIIAFFKGGGFGFQGQISDTRGLGGMSEAGGFSGGGAGFNMLDLAPVISPELLLLAILMAIAVGAIAGLIPAWRASRLDPVVALRTE